jgi:hypothetical protein
MFEISINIGKYGPRHAERQLCGHPEDKLLPEPIITKDSNTAIL